MLILGFQKTTLIDYPGKIASTIFLGGCNFRCGYCHNPELISNFNTSSINEEEIISSLRKRLDFIEGVCITGGEPTVHKDLISFIKKIKDLNLLVKLDTNGTNPEMLKKLVELNLLDYVAIDIKTGFSKYEKLTNSKGTIQNIEKSIRILINSSIDYEFRTTVIPGFFEEQDIMEIKKMIKGTKKYYLQQFRPSKTLDPSFSKIKAYSTKELNNFKNKFEVCEVRQW